MERGLKKSTGKGKIKGSDVRNYQIDNPVFCFKNITTNNDYSTKDLSDGHKAKLLDRIIELSNKDWIEMQAYNKNIGYETLKLHSIKIKPNINLTPSDKYIVFRCDSPQKTKSGRIVGVKRDGCFKVLFIDFNFKLYKH